LDHGSVIFLGNVCGDEFLLDIRELMLKLLVLFSKKVVSILDLFVQELTSLDHSNRLVNDKFLFAFGNFTWI
jgi:hypothetical protein